VGPGAWKDRLTLRLPAQALRWTPAPSIGQKDLTHQLFIAMSGYSIKILALIEASSVTGPAKNLIDFARRARLGCSGPLNPAPVETEIVTFDRLSPGANPKHAWSLFDQTDDGGHSNPFIRCARAGGIEVRVIPERFRFDWRVVDGLKTVVGCVCPYIIQTHSVKSHFLLRASGLARKHRWVAFHHGYTATDSKMRAYNKLDRWSLRAAHRVVTVSSAYASRLELLGTSRSKIRVVANAADPESFLSPEITQPRALREQLGVTGTSRMILAVGRLSAEKGHINLVRAVARLCLDHPEHDARLVVVGDGPERASLSLAARSLGLGDRLILTGQVSDPRPYYLAADVMALPSLIEGSPNVLLEAMAAGLPIVATRVGGVPEIISDGLTGLLAEPADFESFSSALNLVLSNTGLSRTLAQNARAVARTSYAPAARARALVDIYRELVPAIRPIHSNSLGVWQTTNR